MKDLRISESVLRENLSFWICKFRKQKDLETIPKCVNPKSIMQKF